MSSVCQPWNGRMSAIPNLPICLILVFGSHHDENIFNWALLPGCSNTILSMQNRKKIYIDENFHRSGWKIHFLLSKPQYWKHYFKESLMNSSIILLWDCLYTVWRMQTLNFFFASGGLCWKFQNISNIGRTRIRTSLKLSSFTRLAIHHFEHAKPLASAWIAHEQMMVGKPTCVLHSKLQ